MSNVTQMVPANLFSDPTLVHHKPSFLDIYIWHIFLILNFTLKKNVHFNKLTKATHAIDA